MGNGLSSDIEGLSVLQCQLSLELEWKGVEEGGVDVCLFQEVFGKTKLLEVDLLRLCFLFNFHTLILLNSHSFFLSIFSRLNSLLLDLVSNLNLFFCLLIVFLCLRLGIILVSGKGKLVLFGVLHEHLRKWLVRVEKWLTMLWSLQN